MASLSRAASCAGGAVSVVEGMAPTLRSRIHTVKHSALADARDALRLGNGLGWRQFATPPAGAGTVLANAPMGAPPRVGGVLLGLDLGAHLLALVARDLGVVAHR